MLSTKLFLFLTLSMAGWAIPPQPEQCSHFTPLLSNDSGGVMLSYGSAENKGTIQIIENTDGIEIARLSKAEASELDHSISIDKEVYKLVKKPEKYEIQSSFQVKEGTNSVLYRTPQSAFYHGSASIVSYPQKVGNGYDVRIFSLAGKFLLAETLTFLQTMGGTKDGKDGFDYSFEQYTLKGLPLGASLWLTRTGHIVSRSFEEKNGSVFMRQFIFDPANSSGGELEASFSEEKIITSYETILFDDKPITAKWRGQNVLLTKEANGNGFLQYSLISLDDSYEKIGNISLDDSDVIDVTLSGDGSLIGVYADGPSISFKPTISSLNWISARLEKLRHKVRTFERIQDEHVIPLDDRGQSFLVSYTYQNDIRAFYLSDRQNKEFEICSTAKSAYRAIQISGEPRSKVDGQQNNGNSYLDHPIGQSRLGPLVVQIHGGPSIRYRLRWDEITQPFTKREFDILRVNYPGSTGLGEEFHQHDTDNPLSRVSEYVINLVQKALHTRKGINEILIIADSFGGFITLNQLHKLKQHLPVSKTILINPLTDPKKSLSRLVSLGKVGAANTMRAYSTQDKFDSSQECYPGETSLYAIVGELDEIIDPRLTKRYWKNCSYPQQNFLSVQGFGHIAPSKMLEGALNKLKVWKHNG